MQSSVQEAQRDAVSADKQQTIPTSTSWGDEFTSFETAGLDAVADDVGNIADAFDRFAFDDVEGAFQQWLRRDDTSYSFEHVTESQDGRTAEQALKEGITHREEGRLKKAVACFEEALNNSAEGLQKERRATAWYLLGLSLAETDDDERAIRALSQGLTEWNGSAVGERRVDNPHAWQSLIALSVSYTNELEVGSALRCIREWLDLWKSRHSGDAEAGIPDVAPSSPATMAHEDLLDRLTTASAANPGDVDLYVVTGILHNLNREYRLAADAFRHAVGLRPGDPSLWNKLGATLANGGESDDALRAYRKTVDINPSMIRAWVNVGTAYSNRSEFAKATRYYLKAIAMTEERELGRDDDMLHVWGYLRTSLVSMSRPDILHLVDARDVSAFREHFSF